MTETPTHTPTFTPTPSPTPTAAPVGVPAGAVVPFAGVIVPEGWLLADGSEVSRSEYAQLWGTIGEIYGAGDGSTTFNLPDLRGRAPIGAGEGSGLTFRAIGTTLGAETHVLTVAEMPPHSHTMPMFRWDSQWIALEFFSSGGGTDFPFGNKETSSVGEGAAHNNMQPSLAINYIIKTESDAVLLSGGSIVPTPTPPQHIVYATVEAGGYDPVTVAYEYSLTGGDFVIGMLLFLLVCLQVTQMLMRKEGSQDG